MNRDDTEVVERVLAGDKAAFGPLIERYRSEAQRLARRMLGDPVEVEDVTQEALLQTFLGLDSLRAPERFRPWLLGIVVNLCKTGCTAPALGRKWDWNEN